ncbi:MAG TPA: adenylate/guanylate cyclase domain-containing protein [Gaiellaceae bacterium]|jgi:predicted ATPase/class 3 adenylate cyclase
MHQQLPSGTVTLLFTDVEGSTKLLHELGEGGYAQALAAHRRVIREACTRRYGVEVDTQGDAFFFAFEAAPAALAAAAELTAALSSGPVQVRVGLHTGTPLVSEEGYVGVDVHRAARIAASGHGGQVLVSESTASLVDGDLRDLGEHRFKDLLAAERVYQLGTRDFPPLRSLGRTNLPVAAWPLLGRERELAEIGSLVASGARLVTLMGPGGSGKTRLALQAAAELSEGFLDGTFFAALAPLRDTRAVRSAVAEAVGLRPDDDLASWLASRRVLLVLDNLEHLQGVAEIVAELLVGEVTVLATSRGPLHLSGERELPVEPLPLEAAVELFVSRAAATGRALAADETVAAVCRRLDNLPLAIELAAARAKLLPPAALLQRLDEALPLLGGGAIDLPERQRTLRATIEWSHDLLDSPAQAGLRRLSVFRGSFTLDAAEAITGADLDQLAALLDQSLLKALGEERFFLLETLREYARERLDEAGETAAYALSHARWYLDRLQANYSARLTAQRPDILAWYEAEEDNLRAMLDRLSDVAPIEAAHAAYLLHHFWRAQGALAEEHERLMGLLAHDGLPRHSRAALLVRLSDVQMHLGQVDAAGAIAREALALAEPASEPHMVAVAELAFHALHRGDTEEAVRLGRQALEEAEQLDDAARIWTIGLLATILMGVNRTEEARSVYERCVREARRSGLVSVETIGLADLGWLDLLDHDYESSRAAYAAALTQLRSRGDKHYEPETLRGLGLASLGLGQREKARAAFREMLELELAATRTHSLFVAGALSGIALAAEPAAAGRAARLRGAVAQLNSDADIVANAYSRADDELERHFERELMVLLGEEAWEREKAMGSTMTLEQAIELARSLSGHSEQAVTAEP